MKNFYQFLHPFQKAFFTAYKIVIILSIAKSFYKKNRPKAVFLNFTPILAYNSMGLYLGTKLFIATQLTR